VADLDKARNELMEKGCMVVTWEGKGNPCYMRDPFGFVFNLWEVKLVDLIYRPGDFHP